MATVELQRIPSDRYVRYFSETKTCGRRSCKCFQDKTYRHGPYWFAQWRDNQNKRITFYIGKTLPEGTVIQRVRTRRVRGRAA